MIFPWGHSSSSSRMRVIYHNWGHLCVRTLKFPVSRQTNDQQTDRRDERINSTLKHAINKKLSCRRDTARRFVSLNILLSHPNPLKLIRMRRLSPYSIDTMSVSCTVSEIFSVKNGVTLKPAVGVVSGH